MKPLYRRAGTFFPSLRILFLLIVLSLTDTFSPLSFATNLPIVTPSFVGWGGATAPDNIFGSSIGVAEFDCAEKLPVTLVDTDITGYGTLSRNTQYMYGRQIDGYVCVNNLGMAHAKMLFKCPNGYVSNSVSGSTLFKCRPQCGDSDKYCSNGQCLVCPAGQLGAGDHCVPSYDPINNGAAERCQSKTAWTPHPINGAVGNKYLSETDYRGAAGLSFSRFYNSNDFASPGPLVRSLISSR